MIKKYIVSIESADSPRLNTFLNQDFIRDFKHEFKIIGFNAYQHDVKTYFQQAVAGREKPLTPGEWGCTKSHLMCLEDFLASDAEYALIFEDDAMQKYTFDLVELEKYLTLFDPTVGCLMTLGGIQLKICNKVKGEILEQKIFNRPILEVHPFFYQRMNYAFAYCLNRKMAEMILQKQAQYLKIFDHWKYYLRDNVKLYMTFIFDHPELFEKESHEINKQSYLEQERLNNVDINIDSSEKRTIFEEINYQILKKKLDSYPK